MKSEPTTDSENTNIAAMPDEFIIAIGASAGGMEVIHTIFDNTPTDAVSYVIIQHLSPDHKSFMAELLVKHSKLKIYVVENEMEVLPNCVYVMPEGKNMTIAGGKLILKDRKKSTPNTAVDIFFNSLAEDLGDKSIGIVLSGNGMDGTKGIEAIKRVGGMVIVQDPASTDYSSMPTNAIDSGYYDFILAPKLIPLQIIKYIKQRTLTSNFSNPISEKEEAALNEIINLIKTHTPLDFSDYKRPTIIRRIIRRMTSCNATTIFNYIQILKSNPAEIDILAKEFLISVTKFFRDPAAFDVIQKKVIPEIIENKLLVDTLKIWVIGCATGEEAYSLAILIKEHLMEMKKDMEVKIFASDIDKDALAKASKGFYSEDIIRDVSEKRLKNFFIKEGNGYKVRENIRNMLIFADHDIIHQPPYGKIDFISCRNLLIYFNPTLQKKIFSTMHFCLNVGGYLFLGPSEGIGEFKKSFSEINKKWKIYRNLEGANRKTLSAYSPQQLEVKKKFSYPSFTLKSVGNNVPDNLLEIISNSNLEETSYSAGVCLDENNKVLIPFGKFEKYLLPKLFKDNLLELLPADVSIAVGTSIKKAISKKMKVAVKKINFPEKKNSRFVEILVKPILLENKAFQKIAIVYFRDVEMGRSQGEITEEFDRESHFSSYLSDMEEELSDVKKKLQETYFSLDESNYNIQSYNEELISGNEEMQSSNEELQSINEELTTVNSEYQQKIKELAELNDDFDNYFRSTINSQIYVDKNLLIKKFTPVAMRQINIKENDIGRPLGDISTNIRYTHLIEDIREVIRTTAIKKVEVETIDGRWFLMVILPYVRTQDGEIDGAIITFNDITDIKKSNDIIKAANNKLVKINDDHDTFIYSVSHDLKSPLNNMEGLLSLIQRSDDLQQIKTLTIPLIKSVIKLKETIDELSDITKIESETEEAEQVKLFELLEEVKWSIREELFLSKAHLNIQLDETQIRFSKKNLRSILLNLLSNAIKYRSPDRDLLINIKSQRVKDFILLSVEDNGLGITRDNFEKIFNKFKQVDESKEGSGIGLFLVKKMITNSDGEIEVDSKFGKGTSFKVYFKA